MKKGPYYTEDILVEKMQNGEYGWLDYVNHFSEDWQHEYESSGSTTSFVSSSSSSMSGIG